MFKANKNNWVYKEEQSKTIYEILKIISEEKDELKELNKKILSDNNKDELLYIYDENKIGIGWLGGSQDYIMKKLNYKLFDYNKKS